MSDSFVDTPSLSMSLKRPLRFTNTVAAGRTLVVSFLQTTITVTDKAVAVASQQTRPESLCTIFIMRPLRVSILLLIKRYRYPVLAIRMTVAIPHGPTLHRSWIVTTQPFTGLSTLYPRDVQVRHLSLATKHHPFVVTLVGHLGYSHI
jgi:hypothetical protein